MANERKKRSAARARAATHILTSMPRDLVSTWLYFQMLDHNRTRDEAVAYLNEQLGTSYRPHRVLDWRRPASAQRPPRSVQEWLLRQTILPMLKLAGFKAPLLTADQFDLLISRLLTTPRPNAEAIERAKHQRGLAMTKKVKAPEA